MINVIKKMIMVTFGLMILSVGVVCYLKSGLGVDAFTVFYEGVAKTVHISIGRSAQVCLLTLVCIVFFIDRSRLGIGTVMHALLVGVFIDLIMELNIPDSGNIILSVIILLIGIFFVGTGLAIYIKAGLGVGAVDAIMIIVHKRIKKPIKWVKMGLDCTLAVIGFLLGGTLGIGTVFGVLFTGPVIEMVLKILNMITPKTDGNSQLV